MRGSFFLLFCVLRYSSILMLWSVKSVDKPHSRKSEASPPREILFSVYHTAVHIPGIYDGRITSPDLYVRLLMPDQARHDQKHTSYWIPGTRTYQVLFWVHCCAVLLYPRCLVLYRRYAFRCRCTFITRLILIFVLRCFPPQRPQIPSHSSNSTLDSFSHKNIM